jgi:molybdate transport system substrate-binding protein
MTTTLRLISSMATRALLADLREAWLVLRPDIALDIESVGGVDAARRVQAGEAVDAVVLAAGAIDQLTAAGHIVPGTRADLVRSGVAVAVRAGDPAPDIGSEDAVRQAVLAARSVSFSTGPSGVHLQQVFDRWGIADEIRPRLVQAPPGVPVGSLVASGEVELGFQQLAELMNLPGIRVLGPLPPAIQIITVFSAGLSTTSTQAAAVSDFLAWAVSPATTDIKRRNGMESAT